MWSSTASRSVADGDQDLYVDVRVACAESHEVGFKEATAAMTVELRPLCGAGAELPGSGLTAILEGNEPSSSFSVTIRPDT